jgi:hypothetical protein
MMLVLVIAHLHRGVFLRFHKKVNARYALAFFAGSRPAAID